MRAHAAPCALWILLGTGCARELELAWEVDLGADYAADLSGDDDRVYVTTRNPYGGAGAIHAHDAATGEELWVVDAHPVQLMLHDGQIYTVDDHSFLLALDAGTGAELWRASGYDLFMFAGAPDGDVYVSRWDETWTHHLNRIAREGANIWQVDPPHPLLWLSAGADGTVYGAGTDEQGAFHVSAFEPEEGGLLWTTSYPDSPSGPASVGPDALYLGGTALRALSTDDGGLLWEAAITPMTVPAVDSDGHLYLSAAEGLISLDTDGTQRWSSPGYGWTAPALARDGTLITTLPDAEGYARLRVLDRATGEILERPEDAAGCMDEAFLYGVGGWNTGPLLSDGRVFLNSGAWGARLCAWKGAAQPDEGPWIRASGDAGSTQAGR